MLPPPHPAAEGGEAMDTQTHRLLFRPEEGIHAPRLRASVFQRGGDFVLRMVVPRGYAGERTFATMADAFAAFPSLHNELMGNGA
jgi:hypothetical protein